MLKASELRNLSREELREKLGSLKKSLYELNSQRVSGHIEKPSRIRDARRDIARVLTVLREKKERQGL